MGSAAAGQGLLLVIVGHRDLGGGNQVIIPAFELEKVFPELGQLAGAHHALAVNHKGRQDFRVAVFPGVQVQHEIDQGPFQPRAQAFVDHKPGPG